MKLARLEAALVVTAVIGLAFVLFWAAHESDHPVAAIGGAVQTLAGTFAAVQLWANRASDGLIHWAARQIDANRWYVAGLLDGRPISALIATIWVIAAFFSLKLPTALGLPNVIGLPFAIATVIFVLVGFLVWCLALFVCTGAMLVAESKPLPSGAALTSLNARLATNDWIWPLVALAFFAGGLLQIASS